MAQILAIIFLSIVCINTAQADPWLQLKGHNNKSSFKIIDVSTLSEPPLLPKNGVLDEYSVLKILRSLNLDGFAPVLTPLLVHNIKEPCLMVKALGDADKGIHTGQLFAISVNRVCFQEQQKSKKPHWQKLYILKESHKGKEELCNLNTVKLSSLGAEYRSTEALMHEPHAPHSMALIAFEDVHFKLKINHEKRFFSLLQSAQGKSLHDHLLAFAQKLNRPDQDIEKTMLELTRMRKIFYRVGFSISKLHQKYSRDDINRIKLLGKTFTHGDFHAQNIFFDDASDNVTLIDNETFVLSLQNPTSGVNDIVDLYLLHTVKTIAHRFSHIMINQEMGIEDGIWHDLWHELFRGYLEAYNFTDSLDLLAATWEFRSRFYEGVHNTKFFNSINNFNDQRMLKRVNFSLRRFYLQERYLDPLFMRLEQTLNTSLAHESTLIKLDEEL